MDKLYLVIPAILAVGILIGGYFVYQEYFAYELPSDYKTSETMNSSVSPGEASSISPSETSTKPNSLELISPYTQAGLSWRIRATGQIEIDNKWHDLRKTVTRTDIISVDEKNGSRVLLTIEDGKALASIRAEDKETASRMIGRRFEYLVSPDGKAHSFSIADGRSLEFHEIEFYGNIIELSDISGIFLKKQPLIPGDQWTEEYEDKVPGYPNSYIRGTDRYQFVKYEFRSGVEDAIIQAHCRGSAGGFPWEKVVEPKAIHYVQLDQVNFDQRWEYHIDVESGRLMSGMCTANSSGIKGTVTSVITGRRVPVTEVVEQESGTPTRAFFTVEYLP